MQTRTMIEVSDQERQVIELMRGIAYGEMTVFIKGSNPYRVQEVRKSIQLEPERMGKNKK